jgi:hypothetical protein
MAGLVPAIHALPCSQDVDARHRAGHDGGNAGGQAMPEAFIYDHVRTPRGRGKADGALHEVTALNLASQALGAIKDRNKLDQKSVLEVVLC